jgi:hypothetical protein
VAYPVKSSALRYFGYFSPFPPVRRFDAMIARTGIIQTPYGASRWSPDVREREGSPDVKGIYESSARQSRSTSLFSASANRKANMPTTCPSFAGGESDFRPLRAHCERNPKTFPMNHTSSQSQLWYPLPPRYLPIVRVLGVLIALGAIIALLPNVIGREAVCSLFTFYLSAPSFALEPRSTRLVS